MKVIFAGGGTGGHIYPAIAVADELKTRVPDCEILFIGGTRGIERKIAGASGYTVKTVEIMGMPRKPSPAFLPFTVKLGKSIMQCRGYIREFKPSVVISTGGYVSGPAVLAALTLRTSIAMIEGNAYPGITNRAIARFADVVFLGVEDTIRHLPKLRDAIMTGIPVRKGIDSGDSGEAAKMYGFDPKAPALLIFGGSQGSRAINNAVSEAVGDIAAAGIQVLWQTGHKSHEEYRCYESYSVRVVPYIERMELAYALADLVISRAGMMSIAEMTACGLPGILIPLPTAAENHQERNAQALADAGAAEMIRERDLKGAKLARRVIDLMNSTSLAVMADASKRLGNIRASSLIVDTLISRFGVN